MSKKKLQNELKKYSQRLNLAIAVTGAIIAGLPLLRDDLGTYYGIIFIFTSIISAVCVAKKQTL